MNNYKGLNCVYVWRKKTNKTTLLFSEICNNKRPC